MLLAAEMAAGKRPDKRRCREHARASAWRCTSIEFVSPPATSPVSVHRRRAQPTNSSCARLSQRTQYPDDNRCSGESPTLSAEVGHHDYGCDVVAQVRALGQSVPARRGPARRPLSLAPAVPRALPVGRSGTRLSQRVHETGTRVLRFPARSFRPTRPPTV